MAVLSEAEQLFYSFRLDLLGPTFRSPARSGHGNLSTTQGLGRWEAEEGSSYDLRLLQPFWKSQGVEGHCNVIQVQAGRREGRFALNTLCHDA